MRIVLEVEGGEVTFTVRQAGQLTGDTRGTDLTQVRTGRAVDAGSAALTQMARSASPGRVSMPPSAVGVKGGKGKDAGPAPQRLASGSGALSLSTGRAVPRGRGAKAPAGGSGAQAGEKAATDAGPAPRHPGTKAQAASLSNQAGESFNLMGGAGRNAGPAPALHTQRRVNPSKRRVTHSNGGKSK